MGLARHTASSVPPGTPLRTAATRRLLKDLFRQFTKRGGTVLMSTHTLEVAEAMCDRIAIIQSGRIAACGTMADLRRQTAGGDASLEELFLRLTGGAAIRELAAILEG